MNDSDFDKLDEIARLTDDVRPSKSFADAVMSSIEELDVDGDRDVSNVISIGDGVSRSGTVAVALAAMAAAACIWLSFDSQQSFDDDVLATVDTVEFDAGDLALGAFE